jgi:hypothetical protein
MPGYTQSLLILSTGLKHWVVKFRDNPFNKRLVLNEFIASSIAKRMGLTIPPFSFLEVEAFVLAEARERLPRFSINEHCHKPGLHFASRYVLPEVAGSRKFIPSQHLGFVSNLNEAIGAFVFDVWLGNKDQRQVVFAPEGAEGFRAWWIDQGECFGGSDWDQDWDNRRRFLRRPPLGWEGVDELSLWVERVQAIKESTVRRIISRIPEPLVMGEDEALDSLVGRILSRRNRIRELLMNAFEAAPLDNPISDVSLCARTRLMPYIQR